MCRWFSITICRNPLWWKLEYFTGSDFHKKGYQKTAIHSKIALFASNSRCFQVPFCLSKLSRGNMENCWNVETAITIHEPIGIWLGRLWWFPVVYLATPPVDMFSVHVPKLHLLVWRQLWNVSILQLFRPVLMILIRRRWRGYWRNRIRHRKNLLRWLHYITLHYRHFKRHLHLKWPEVHPQLHVIRNTAHRPSMQASYTAGRVRPKKKSAVAAQIAAILTISFPQWRHMSLPSYWEQQRMSLTSYPGQLTSHQGQLIA